MKSAMQMSPAEIREAAHEAIVRELGIAGLIRYLQDRAVGGGDYTRDRQALQAKYDNVDQLWGELEAARKPGVSG